jgi:hypothetical protein
MNQLCCIEQFVLENRAIYLLPNAEGTERGQGAAPESAWKCLDIEISEEDITQARREMWGNFHEISPDACRARHSRWHLVSPRLKKSFPNCLFADRWQRLAIQGPQKGEA